MTLISLRIRAIRQETVDTKSFELESTNIQYQPGQFLTVVQTDGAREVRRQYSFSSHPVLDKNATITVKRIANGEVSRWLFDRAIVGDIILTTGTSGRFTLPENVDEFTTVVFLAAGSGITPIYSLIREVLLFHRHLHVVLIYSNHTEQSTIFLKELRQLCEQFPERFRIEFLFSDNKNLMRARLGKTVLEDILNMYVVSPSTSLAYVCGPLDYRQMAIMTLLAFGFSFEAIHKEVFHTPPPRAQPEPPDKEKHSVRISYRGHTHQLLVQYPKTILAVAKEKHIELPYSCEAGRCGTCAATCTSGEVWMSRNEVLTDRELKNGRVLTCTGFPIKGDVEVTF